MDYYILQYIRQRMAEMGFTNFTFQPVRIQASPLNPGSASIDASNEYYYLVAQTLAAGTTTIICDTSYFEETNSAYAKYNFNGIEEFTGQIEIANSAGNTIDLEFIRVIPIVEDSEEKKKFIAAQQLLVEAAYKAQMKNK